MTARFEAFFLPAAGGQRFGLLHEPAAGRTRRGSMLYVHPFAEEMNKSRRAAASCARALADDGWTVLQIDLLGCGDSSGDFGDAAWEAWIEDIALAHRWLAERTSQVPVLWGLRAGCLLVAETIARLASQPPLVLWQPVVSGKLHLAQFLRLRAAAGMLNDQAERTDTKALRTTLTEGKPVDVAGYCLAPSLALPMERSELVLPTPYAGRVLWLEVAAPSPADAATAPAVSPASAARIQRWRDASARVDVETVAGLPFWQTQEIDEAPALVAATTRLAASLVQ